MIEVTRPGAPWRDYWQLCKPRVVGLMLVCAVVGMFLAAPGAAPAATVLFATLGIGAVAASAAAVNHILDAEVDARMARTERRPVPSGRVGIAEGLAFAAALGAAGMLLLYLRVNPLTAWLNLASWVGYGIVYTLFLKRATPQNIVLGGLFGAAPPLFGWTAVTGAVEAGGLLLVLIIFVWTPPHFWALALERKEEYAAAGIPMLPVTHGEASTRRHIFGYTLVLVASSLGPFFVGMSGPLYLVAALALGGGFAYRAWGLLAGRDPGAPMKTFRYSILYLFALFLFLLLDRYLPG